jgi:hypothetical protein
MIYVLLERETGLYKIGKARNKAQAYRARMPAISRKRAAQLGRRCKLSFYLWVDWPGPAEMDIHRYLWRLWEGDEWFRDGPELQRFFAWTKDGHGYDEMRKHMAAQPRSAFPQRWSWKNRDAIIAAFSRHQCLV